MKKILISILIGLFHVSALAQYIGPIYTPGNVKITGGTINGASVGASNTSTGAFTTLTASGEAMLGGGITQGGTQFQTTSGGVNYIRMKGATAGNPITFASEGTDVNVGIDITTKGAGNQRFFTGGTSAYKQFEITHTGTTVNYLHVSGGVAGTGPYIEATGSDTNVPFRMYAKGTGPFSFYTGGGEQLRIVDTPSTVNVIDLTGSAAGNTPSVSTAGSDTNIPLSLLTKGTGSISLKTGGGEQVRVTSTASAVNYAQITGAATGSGPALSSAGSDTNIDLNLTPKGSGKVNLGVATATTINGNAITTGTGTLTLGAGKTFTANNTLTLSGTDGTTMTFPSTSATVARTDAANTFTGAQAISAGNLTIDNAQNIVIKDSGGTSRNVLKMDASNQVQLLSNGASGTISLQIASVEKLGITNGGVVSAAAGVTVGADLQVGATNLTVPTGGIGMAKITASGTAPGAGGAKLEVVCGTNAGTAKLIIYAGTSTTAVTIADNIGGGVTGC